VHDEQRTRILDAISEAACARGIDGASVTTAEVIAYAGVSAETFFELFADRDECLLAAFELALARVRKRAMAAYDAEPRWLDAIKAGLAEVLRYLEDEPAFGRLLIVYSMSGGKQLLRRRVGVLATLAAVVDRGRHEAADDRRQPATIIGEGVVGAVIAVLQNQLLRDDGSGVLELFGALVSIIVLPYLGAGVARRELVRPVPPVRVSGFGMVARGTLRDGEDVRLTYRTAQVLIAIADYPGASNREVADHAGIVDQGQISKLLGRLQGAKLIAKIGDGRTTRGAPNSWRLTERGESLLRRILSEASRS
jgi:AcrR family transcriptional regulator/DNA-binding MarR family transcriptional regulator